MTYELLYILPSQYADSEIDGIKANISTLIEKVGAKIEKSDTLGKIKLAYPINKARHGTYVLTYFTLEEKDLLLKLDRELRHTEEVLRHVIVKREDGIPAHPITLTSYEEPITPEGKRTKKEKVEEVQVKQEPIGTEKLSTEELDKKLDEILDKDISL